MIWRKLPCKQLLTQRDIIPINQQYCDLCFHIVEDEDHVLVDCSFAKSCWAATARALGMDFRPSSLPGLEQCALLSQVEKWLRLFMVCVAWSIWTARNERSFQQLTISPVQVFRRAMFLVSDLSSSASTQENPWSWGDILPAQSAPRNIKLVGWLPPPMGILKLYFDASISSQCTGAAFIIGDYQGNLVKVGVKRLLHCSIPYAELVAV